MTISYRLKRSPARAAVELSAEQAAVAAHRRGALLVLGGPRTGKTTASAASAVSGLQAGLPHVLFITGSRRAGLAVRSRIGEGHPQLAGHATVTTLYGLCQSVVRRAGGGLVAPVVLSAARQDAYVRQMLAGQPAEAWPERFERARTTTRFASEVREAVAACQRASLSPADVVARAAEAGRDDWAGLGRFYAEYLDIIGLAGVLDYPELLWQAARLMEDEEVLAGVRPPGSLVVIDSGEDLDPAQASLVARLVDATTPAILAADPDCEVYGFRGARTRSTGWLLEQWAARGLQTRVVSLTTGYGVAAAVQQATGPVRSRIGLPAGTDAGALAAYRGVKPDTAGAAAKYLFADTQYEAERIAWMLKTAHFRDEVPYDKMAILVRKRDQFAPYALACRQAGVPVALSGDEIQLNQEGIVTTLLAGLRVVRAGEPNPADVAVVEGSPLVRAVDAGRAALAGGSAGDVLWAMWEGSGWQEALLGQAETPGQAGYRANRDLDAAVALFALAERLSDLQADKGIPALCDAVAAAEIPEDLPRSSSWNAAAVRLTTAHRAKGQSWQVVVVAGVQEGTWPMRSRPAQVVSATGLPGLEADDERELLAGERRLLYAACACAEQVLVVTAATGEDARPSALFDQIEAASELDWMQAGEPESPAGVVARLRRVAGDESAHPGLRQAAADRLAGLWDNPLFPSVRPSTWWAVAPDALPAGQPEPSRAVSASSLADLFDCPRRWYLSSEALGARPPGPPARIGSVIHQVIQKGYDTLEAMTAAMEQACEEVVFPAGWVRWAELEAARQALARYDSYRNARGRTVIGSEVPVVFSYGSGPVLQVSGRIDRLELDSEGQVWVVDFKTGARVPTKAEAAANVQLGLYQLGLRQGALRELVGPDVRLGGAELVYLKVPAGEGSSYPKVMTQAGLVTTPHLTPDVRLPVVEAGLAAAAGDQWRHPSWADHRLALAAELLRADGYPAVSGKACRGCPVAKGCPVAEPEEDE